jgi:ABC-type nitrate/sulfonate/bicarbonate transport system substrate-binding protein
MMSTHSSRAVRLAETAAFAGALVVGGACSLPEYLRTTMFSGGSLADSTLLEDVVAELYRRRTLARTEPGAWCVSTEHPFMAATPEFVDRNPDTVVAYLKAWFEVGRDFRQDPGKVADVLYGFYTSKGYKMSRETLSKAISTIDVNPDFPADLKPYMQEQAEVLLKANKIKAIPDWGKALRPEFMRKARG